MKWKKRTYKKYLACACCGEEEKCKLEIHHIMPKSIYPELIDVETNLIVLCHTCHKYLHEVVCHDNIHECGKESLNKLFCLIGNKKGKKVRKKAKSRKW